MSRADQRGRLGWLLVLISMLMGVGVWSIWLCSWRIETEIRWMHNGTHRHFEIARGTVTYVTTTGERSGDYFVVASSSNLSYGRDPNWYAVTPPGQTRWRLRLHWTVCLILIVLFSAVGVRLSMSLIPQKSDERRKKRPTRG